jgi:hypothetical protein
MPLALGALQLWWCLACACGAGALRNHCRERQLPSLRYRLRGLASAPPRSIYARSTRHWKQLYFERM